MALEMPDSIRDFFRLFGRKGRKRKRQSYACGYIGELTQEIQLREAAFHACVNLIANCISKCELRTYKKNKFKKDSEWYRWNIQPNPNMNATEFWQRVIHRLYEDNEALIVARPNGELYVADSFVCDDSQAFNPHTYHDIVIDDLDYPPVLTEDKVFYFALHDINVKALIDDVTGLYGKLISAFLSNYTEAAGVHGILYVDQIAEAAEDFDETMNNLMQEDFKKFFTDQKSVLPLFDGFKYEELDRQANAGMDTRDFHSQITDIFELYAMAFGIPKVLITGEVQDTSKAVDNLLTFALDPVLELIADELNRKIFEQEDFLKGDCVKWRTNAVRHIDIMDVAGNVEKLISSGFCCIDDIREVCGMDRLNTPWSTQFFMTKNFSTIEDLLKSIERSDGNDEQGNGQKTESPVPADQESTEESDGPGTG